MIAADDLPAWESLLLTEYMHLEQEQIDAMERLGFALVEVELMDGYESTCQHLPPGTPEPELVAVVAW